MRTIADADITLDAKTAAQAKSAVAPRVTTFDIATS